MAGRSSLHPSSDAAQFPVDIALVAAGEAAGTTRPSSLTILPVLSMFEALAAGRHTLIMASQVRMHVRLCRAVQGLCAGGWRAWGVAWQAHSMRAHGKGCCAVVL